MSSLVPMLNEDEFLPPGRYVSGYTILLADILGDEMALLAEFEDVEPGNIGREFSYIWRDGRG